ncbi:hypothetical protein ES319_D13G009600v1 [Gossypium barbadense]|uniref:DC1 domain-containing protein n=1 Tax=Gossypium barbadense TaxID=3634 RepID=A0A5J5NKG1_GOSBA|nr:hypothetical protein ES319_D13G009600v1 [Gossypium barbadense]
MLNEEQLLGNGNGVVDCSRCGEKNPPYTPYTRCVCDFCNEACEKFIYHCSCGLDFHIKCALFTFNIAERNLKELEHVALEDPSFSSKNDGGNLGKCFVCWEPLAMYTYFFLDCGFKLHKRCAELPLKMDHSCHRKHPLVLQFNSERRACKICQVTQGRGYLYGCSPCELAIHIDCLSPLPVIESLLAVQETNLQGQINQLKTELNEKGIQIEALNKNLDKMKLKYDMLMKDKDCVTATVNNLVAELTKNLEDELKLKIKDLEKEVDKQRNMILDVSEEKREVIRQLTFSLDHYRSGYKELQTFLKHKRQAFIAL